MHAKFVVVSVEKVNKALASQQNDQILALDVQMSKAFIGHELKIMNDAK
jgi:hypothetical protein